MSTHDLSDEGVAARLEPVARRAIAEFGLAPDTALTLLNVSENATYAADDPATAPLGSRCHGPSPDFGCAGYSS